jgi:hypothetical protein
MGVGGQRHAPGRFTPAKDQVSIVQEAGLATGSVWTVVENLTPTGIWSPDLATRSKSLYWLSYPGPLLTSYVDFNLFVLLLEDTVASTSYATYRRMLDVDASTSYATYRRILDVDASTSYATYRRMLDVDASTSNATYRRMLDVDASTSYATYRRMLDVDASTS